MRNNISISGLAFKLRPVELADASFIVDIRTKDKGRSEYIHPISSDASIQEEWIKKYFTRDDDYYFVIENLITGKNEGLIGIYNIDPANKIAEWGRWILYPESLGAAESAYLIYLVAFEKLGLKSLFSRTVKDNKNVVSFHDSFGAIKKQIIHGAFDIDGKKYDAVEHFVDIDTWENIIRTKAENIAKMIYDKLLKQEIGKMELHHIGVATKEILPELEFWKRLGYQKEGEFFEDNLQGIRGVFITAKNQPRLELLENLPISKTLDVWLEKGIKFYQFAYTVEDINETANMYISKFRAKMISSQKPAAAFESRNICFLMFSNGMIIELIERRKNG
jgi:RimJ/RimL family protein N-acetyltransferase